ncbi:class I SAM-dependent methyltransferase [Methylobacterium mesophilicum SR1.6/6]|uniref:Class I SAM-dependent methyltransferase n=1 Tax=Methylobacterium mesophilicum SR1.6/6 TaxID=908290 RepID=A0A6B9FDA0_9HYPH|nr:class I SAM-dependent methyltransferase [Methylobacterium mesophilicum]QGY00632.1 class I SAM-dependent methyltransferase [Methylobacterium mesophilicum SR1.6/6]
MPSADVTATLAASESVDIPPCPITGAPAIRCIERLDTTFLTALWHVCGRVDVGPLLMRAGPIRLWESPTGLAFFHPPVDGDEAFYRGFYKHISAHEKLAGTATVRREFQKAAEQVPDGARVLDVGCGEGGFRHYVPRAHYTGLDPNFAAIDPSGAILDETVEAHGRRVGPVYDVACAFQVLEHVSDPLGFARAMAACVKPGGLVLLGTPLWPSPNTTLPNFVINAPPHHLTWWTPNALEVLAREIGCTPEAVHPIGMDQHDSIVHWMVKMSPVRCRDRFFRFNWGWLASLAFAYAVGSRLDRWLKLPNRTPTNAILLVARKAG